LHARACVIIGWLVVGQAREAEAEVAVVVNDVLVSCRSSLQLLVSSSLFSPTSIVTAVCALEHGTHGVGIESATMPALPADTETPLADDSLSTAVVVRSIANKQLDLAAAASSCASVACALHDAAVQLSLVAVKVWEDVDSTQAVGVSRLFETLPLVVSMDVAVQGIQASKQYSSPLHLCCCDTLGNGRAPRYAYGA
jgi:hypothetical protein